MSEFGLSKVGKYDATSGAAINPSFITGLSGIGLALDGSNHLFVANGNINRVGEYDATTGAAINAKRVPRPKPAV